MKVGGAENNMQEDTRKNVTDFTWVFRTFTICDTTEFVWNRSKIFIKFNSISYDFILFSLLFRTIRCDMKWCSRKRAKWNFRCWHIRTIWNEFQHVHKGLLTFNSKINYLECCRPHAILKCIRHVSLIVVYWRFHFSSIDIFMVRLMELPLHWQSHCPTNMECMN